MIRVRAVGQSIIEVRRVVIRPDAEAVFATLLVLCAERGRRVERETLHSLLWPQSSADRRRHNLRQVLYKLRRLGVETGDASGALSLPASSVWLDFEDVGTKNARETVHDLTAPGGVRFMPGYAPRISKPFTEWLDVLRARAEGNVRTRLVDAIAAARRDWRWEDVEKLARNCLQLDPLNEAATFALAESIALSGSKLKAAVMLDAYSAEVPDSAADARLPAAILRRRIVDRMAPRRLHARLETKLIGREDVMQTFMEVLEKTRAGCAATHVVWGAPGIGKTRVLEEIGNIAVLTGGRVFAQHAAPDDPQTPGLSLVRLLRVMMEAPGVLGIAPDVLALLRQLTAKAPGVESDQPLDLGDDVLVRAVVDLERALAWEGFIVIVLDDLHHADALSRRVLSRAQGCLTTERVLLLTGSIPQPAEGAMASVTTHQIGRLSESATAILAAAFLEKADATADASTIDALATAAGGHPFVLREAVIAWLRDPGTTSQSTLEAMLQRRVGSLSAEGRDVLFTTLILGEHASVSLLMGCATLPAVEVEQALVELEQEQIVRCWADGTVSTHSLWRSSVDTLVPTALAVARRHRVAQLLEEASRHTADSAELLLASAALYQRSGDVARAADILAQSGAALQERALAPAAYAAYSRAAELAPGGEEFERSVFQALTAAHQAQLPHEALSLLDRSATRLQSSLRLSGEQRAEIEVISAEVRRLMFHDAGHLSAHCRDLLKRGELTHDQQLRVALAGVTAAEHDADVEGVAEIGRLVSALRITSSYDHHLVRRIGIVCAVAERRLADALQLADHDIGDVDETWPLHERCQSLLHARVPYLFDCNYVRVEEILNTVRATVEAYPSTFLALRVEDMYATHCVEMLRLAEASDAMRKADEIARTLDPQLTHYDLRETRVRLAIAQNVDSFDGELWKRVLKPLLDVAPGRLRVVVLADAAIGLARTGERRILSSVVEELASQWKRITRVCPFDYPCVALGAGLSSLGRRSDALTLTNEYLDGLRVARHGPSPLVLALADEFALPF